MEKRDLKADLENVKKVKYRNRVFNYAKWCIEEGLDISEHAIERALKAERALGNETILNGKALAKLNERALKAESLARELAEALDEAVWFMDSRGDEVDDLWNLVSKAKEVLGDE